MVDAGTDAVRTASRASGFRWPAPAPDAVPEVILHTEPTDRLLWDYAAPHWHALVFERHLDGRIGQTFDFRRAAAPFARVQERAPSAAFQALARYLLHLRRRGYLSFTADGDYIRGPIRVLADTQHPPRDARARLAELQAASRARPETPAVRAGYGAGYVSILPAPPPPAPPPRWPSRSPPAAPPPPPPPPMPTPPPIRDGPDLGAEAGVRVRVRFVDGKAGTTFTLEAVVAFLGGAVARGVVIRFLMQLHAEGLLGEPGTPLYYGGPLTVRASR